MDVSRGRTRRALAALAVLLVLLAAVAVASSGGTPLGDGGARRPADAFLDTFVSLLLVLMALGTLLIVYVLVLRRDLLAEQARRRRQRRGDGFVAAFVAFGLVAIAVWWMSERGGDRTVGPPSSAAQPGAPSSDPAVEQPYDPEFALVPTLVFCALVVVAAVGAYLSYRARRRSVQHDDDLGIALADVLGETLDDLHDEADPARAVIAAYARLERVLAAYGLPRLPAEAPQEYVGRVLADLEVGQRSVERLTALYLVAKFSQHDVRPAMRTDAIAALEQVRDDLRAADERAAHERAAALAAAQERAAG
jgi:Domain of unknown function (DUF4129)